MASGRSSMSISAGRHTSTAAPGRDLLRHVGKASVRDVAWPFPSAVFDGEAVAGDGHEDMQGVFVERNKIGGDMAFVAFDVLDLDSHGVMRDPSEHRRTRLEDLLTGAGLPNIGLVPVTNDAAAPYKTWVGRRGDRAEGSRLHLPPGCALAWWLKVRPKHTVSAEVVAFANHGKTYAALIHERTPRCARRRPGAWTGSASGSSQGSSKACPVPCDGLRRRAGRRRRSGVDYPVERDDLAGGRPRAPGMPPPPVPLRGGTLAARTVTLVQLV